MTLAQWSIVTALIVILANLGVIIIRKRFNLAALRKYNEVTDPLLAVVGTLFAILLGFMVANAMARFEEARSNIQQEAGALGDIFRLADGLPDPISPKLRIECLQYAQVVVNEEWQLMEDDKLSDKAWNISGDMWQQLTHFEPKTQREANIHQTLLECMTKFGESRRTRFAQLTYALPNSMWLVVSVGGLAIIVFTYFFGLESLPLQLTMTTIVATILALNIFLLVAFDNPFGGEVRISSTPFQTEAIVFKSVLEHDWH